jgi:4-hydroxybenzoate polyprenyltransferase
VLLVAVLLAYEQSLVGPDDLTRVKLAFDLNGWVGLLYFAATALDVYFA